MIYRRVVAFAAVALAAAGCGSQASSTVDESTIVQAINEQVGDPDFRVTSLKCAESGGACTARAETLNGPTSVPVTVSGDSWQIDGPDLYTARQGPSPKAEVVGRKVFALGGGGEKIEFTVLGEYPLEPTYPDLRPDPGDLFVGIRLKARNLGTDSWSGLVAVSLDLADGQQVDPYWSATGDCDPQSASTVAIRPGDELTACVPFEVGEEAVVKRALIGTDLNDHILAWNL